MVKITTKKSQPPDYQMIGFNVCGAGGMPTQSHKQLNINILKGKNKEVV